MNISRSSLFQVSAPWRLLKRLRSLGLKHTHAEALVTHVITQVESRGPEGAIFQLKREGQALREWFFNLPRTTSWVSLLADGMPRKYQFLREYEPRVLLAVSRLHTSLVLAEPTQPQVEKFTKAVSTPLNETEKLVVPQVSDLVASGIQSLGIPLLNRDFPSQNVLTYSLSQLDGTNKRRQDDWVYLSRAVSVLKEHPKLFYNKRIAQVFHPIAPRSVCGDGGLLGPTVTLVDRVKRSLGLVPEYMGSIGMTQEPGGKLRTYAAPHHLFQAATMSLMRQLRMCLSAFPRDCTFDHSRGPTYIQSWMDGRKIYSVDLTSATDRFPLEPQLRLLRELCADPDDIKLIEQISRGRWKCPKSLSPEGEISWKVGQPLGLMPSFFLFAATHNALLEGICRELCVTDSPYLILGDDVLIAHKGVHTRYVSLMKQIGVDISAEKSMHSTSAAEFAGFYITRDFAIRPGKLRRLTKQNLKSYIEVYGKEIAKEAPKSLRRVAVGYAEYLYGQVTDDSEPFWLKPDPDLTAGIYDPWRIFHASQELFGRLGLSFRYVSSDPDTRALVRTRDLAELLITHGYLIHADLTLSSMGLIKRVEQALKRASSDSEFIYSACALSPGVQPGVKHIANWWRGSFLAVAPPEARYTDLEVWYQAGIAVRDRISLSRSESDITNLVTTTE